MHRGPATAARGQSARSPTRASSPGRGHASHGRTADAYMAHVVPHHRHIIRSYTRIRRLWVRAAWSVDCHQGAGKQHTGVSLCETLAGTLATYIIIIRMRAACRMPHAACRMRPRARPGVEDAVAMLSPLLTPPQHRGRTTESGKRRVPCSRAMSPSYLSHRCVSPNEALRRAKAASQAAECSRSALLRNAQ